MKKLWWMMAIILLLSGLPGSIAQEIDKDKAMELLNSYKSGKNKGKLKDLIEDFKNQDQPSSGGDTGSTGTPGEPASAMSPAELDIPAAGKPLDEADKQYCEVHIKNAKRNYRQKKFDRAMDEIRNVLSVDPNHGEAYFMKSVIEAKKKEFPQAWKDLEKARSILGDSPKMTDFQTRLQKVSPKPENLDTMSVGSRPIPTHVSEYAMDLVEVFFTDKDAAKNVSGLSWKEIPEEAGKTRITFSFKGKDKLNAEAIKARLKTLSGSEATDLKEEDGGKGFVLTVTSPHAAKNAAPSSIAKTMDFLDTLSKECDVKVETETENAVGADKVMQGTYLLMSAGLTELNTFFRKASPNTEKYWVENLEYTMEGRQPVWKAKTVFRFKMQ